MSTSVQIDFSPTGETYSDARQSQECPMRTELGVSEYELTNFRKCEYKYIVFEFVNTNIFGIRYCIRIRSYEYDRIRMVTFE